MNSNAFGDPFHVAPPSDQNVLVFGQIAVKLMTFPSTSAVLRGHCYLAKVGIKC